MSYRVLQYPTKVQPIVTMSQPAERTTPDKWQPLGEEPIFPKRSALLLGQPFLQTPAADTTAVYIGGQNCDPIAIQSFQYEAEVQPVDFETFLQVEVDPWHAWFVPVRRPLRPAVMEGVTPMTPVAAPPTAVYIQGMNTEPIRIVSFQYEDTAAPLFFTPPAPETVTMDKWFRLIEQPYFRPKRLIQYGVNTAVAEERIYPDAFQFMALLPLRQKKVTHLYGQGSQVLRQPQENITLDKWNKNYFDPLFRAKRLYDYGFFQLDPTLRGERITLDKWEPLDNLPVMTQKRWQGLYPALAIDSQFYLVPSTEVIRLDKWGKNYPDLLFRPKRLPDYGFFQLDPTLRLERITLDKWEPQDNLPVMNLRRQQWSYPSLAIDSQFYLVPPSEIIRLDKWGKNYPDLVFRAKRLFDYTYSSVDPTLRAERSSVDKWFTLPQLVRRPAPRVQFFPTTAQPNRLIVPFPLQSVEQPRLKGRSMVHLQRLEYPLQQPAVAAPAIPQMQVQMPVYRRRNQAVYTINNLVFIETPAGTTIIDIERGTFRFVFSGLFNRIN